MAFQFSFEAIGTRWVIDIYGDTQHISSDVEIQLLNDIQDRIARFDLVYSRFRDDSLVTEMSRTKGEYTLPEDAMELMLLYKSFYDITNGLMTPLIGQVLVDAGYDAEYSLKQQRPLQKPPAWEEAIIYEHPQMTIKEPVLLDFGAAGKGYLIDLVGKVIEENGYVSYCIDAGGDILHRDANMTPLRIGLENPHNTQQVIGIVELSNKSICASAGNRRAWGDFHHIIHPENLTSPKEISAIWTIAATTALADALSTALFFVSPEQLSDKYSFECLILYADNSITKSDGFFAELF